MKARGSRQAALHLPLHWTGDGSGKWALGPRYLSAQHRRTALMWAPALLVARRHAQACMAHTGGGRPALTRAGGTGTWSQTAPEKNPPLPLQVLHRYCWETCRRGQRRGGRGGLAAERAKRQTKAGATDDKNKGKNRIKIETIKKDKRKTAGTGMEQGMMGEEKGRSND